MTLDFRGFLLPLLWCTAVETSAERERLISSTAEASTADSSSSLLLLCMCTEQCTTVHTAAHRDISWGIHNYRYLKSMAHHHESMNRSVGLSTESQQPALSALLMDSKAFILGVHI